MSDSFLTITSPAEGLYKEKGSRFLAFVFPVSSVEQVKPIVDEKKKVFHDARHVCYAYRIDPLNPQVRANDDGEPSSTAGRPMLGCLQSRNLMNVLVVVVRYFGGIKLGVSGLANAYKVATEDALDHAAVEVQTVKFCCNVKFDYVFLNDVMKIVKDMKADILAQSFELDCSMTLQIRLEQAETLSDRLSKVETLSFAD